ncbi:MFS transporter [Modestobacter sp. NPDC049651]|uniref:MFS transporter n=1 Tax=unclassified Modestobacter TaxID=2643866 RepID=UPI00340AF21D
MHPIALLAALAAAVVPVMSVFSVNVALRQIGAELGASAGTLQLVVAAYGVVYAALVVIGGRLGDSFGRKRMLLVGLGLFAVTSLLCAVAQTPGQLVAARFVQGVSGAALSPQVLASIHANSDGHHRTRALAWFGATAGLATSLAFLVGGALAGSDLGWRSVFWINTPVALLVVVGVARYLPETKAPARTSLDWIGAVLLGATMTLLILPLTEGRATGWPAWTWACLAAVPVTTAALVRWQLRLQRQGGLPLLPPELFAFRTVRIGLLVATPVYVTFGGFMFVYSFMAGGHGLSPLRIGLSLLPLSLGFLGASIAAGRLMPRFGVGVLAVGGLLTAVGFVWLGVVADGFGTSFGVGSVAGPMVVVGVGLALVWSPLMGVILSQVHGHLAGLGGGVLLTVMQAGLGFGSAVVGSVYFGLGAGHGFAWTLFVLAGVMLVVSPLTRLLRARG